MFAMGIAALVLVTIAQLQTMRTFLSNNELPFSIVICYYAWAGISCLMVCLHDPFISPA
jgi:choline-glycine betaine transporter